MIVFARQLKERIDVEKMDGTFICGDTLDVLSRFPDKSVSMVVTSPSYYLGKSYEKDQKFEEYLQEHRVIIEECRRVLKDNGAIFWNVAQTVMDGEVIPLGAVFYPFFKECGFFLKNWIIWKFEGGETPRSRLFGRYENVLWFVKNKNDYVFNIDEIRVPSKWITDERCNANGKNPEDFWIFDERNNSEKLRYIQKKLAEYKRLISQDTNNYVNQIIMDEIIRNVEEQLDSLISAKDSLVKKNLESNIWHFNRVVNISKQEKIKHPRTGKVHPCPFPERMVERIIKMSTNPGDVVVDIFSGSGTVGKVAQQLDRQWIGIDKELEYCEIAESRVYSTKSQLTLIWDSTSQ